MIISEENARLGEKSGGTVPRMRSPVCLSSLPQGEGRAFAHGHSFRKDRSGSGIFSWAASSASRDARQSWKSDGMPRFAPEAATGLSVKGHILDGGPEGFRPDLTYSIHRLMEEEAAVNHIADETARPSTVAQEPRTTAP